jgi:hypothetical protein
MKPEAVGVLIVILVAASLGVGYLAGSGTRSAETITSTVTAVSTCVAPPPPVQVLTQVGPSPLAIVGASTTCAEVFPAALGSVSLANFTLTLNATKPLRITMVIDINDNGISSVPSGTTFTATDGTQNFTVHDDLHPVQTPATIIATPSGETTFHFQASVPNPYKAGTYLFEVNIFVSSKDSGGGVYSYSVPVNLDAQ